MRTPALLAVALAMPAVLVVAKMVKVYRAAQLEFHLPSRQIGPPPADLCGAEAVEFRSLNGTLLRGWLIPPAGGATIILLHGSENDRRQLLPEAHLLSSHGFGVLMFDWPGQGESSGRVTWGRTEPEALLGALDWLDRRTPGQRIGALGFSLGASMMVSSAAMDPRLHALVVEGIVLDLDEEVAREYGSWGPVSYLAARWGIRAGGWDPGAPKPLETVAKLKGRPLFIINGSADLIAPPADAQRFFDAAPLSKHLWVVDGAGHGGYGDAAPEQYGPRIIAFFQGALGGPDSLNPPYWDCGEAEAR
jgi:pimeloyl-ACP methyl ester carboxylesterase